MIDSRLIPIEYTCWKKKLMSIKDSLSKRSRTRSIWSKID